MVDASPIQPYSTFVEQCDQKQGLVFLDASTRNNVWQKALDHFKIANVAQDRHFEKPFYIQTTGGRMDLVVFYKDKDNENNDNNDTTIDFDRLVDVKLEMCRSHHKEIGRVCYSDDYISNYEKQHQSKKEIFGGVGIEMKHQQHGYTKDNIILCQMINDNDPKSVRKEWE